MLERRLDLGEATKLIEAPFSRPPMDDGSRGKSGWNINHDKRFRTQAAPAMTEGDDEHRRRRLAAEGGEGRRRVLGGMGYFSVESVALLACLTVSLLILPVVLPPLPPPPLMLLLLPIGMLLLLLTLAFMPSPQAPETCPNSK